MIHQDNYPDDCWNRKDAPWNEEDEEPPEPDLDAMYDQRREREEAEREEWDRWML